MSYRIGLTCLLSIFALSTWAQRSYADLDQARILCQSTKNIQVDRMEGHGQVREKIKLAVSDMPFEETNSYWFRLEVENDADLYFQLLPMMPEDDLDFVLLEGEPKKQSLHALQPVRVMQSGAEYDGPLVDKSCLGPTGMSRGEQDVYEAPGCTSKGNGQLKGYACKAGKVYYLVVNNYKSPWGFRLIIDEDFPLRSSYDESESVQLNTQGLQASYSFQTPAGNDVKQLDWKFSPDVVDVKETRQESGAVGFLTPGQKTLKLTIQHQSGCPGHAHLDFQISKTPEALSTISIYPVPVQDALSIKFNATTPQDYNLKITDLNGRQLYLHQVGVAQGVQEFQIPTHALPGGIYLLECTDQNQQRQVFKFEKIN